MMRNSRTSMERSRSNRKSRKGNKVISFKTLDKRGKTQTELLRKDREEELNMELNPWNVDVGDYF